MIEVCKKLLANNEEISKVISYTGLSDEEIEKLESRSKSWFEHGFWKIKRELTTLNIIIILKKIRIIDYSFKKSGLYYNSSEREYPQF